MASTFQAFAILFAFACLVCVIRDIRAGSSTLTLPTLAFALGACLMFLGLLFT